MLLILVMNARVIMIGHSSTKVIEGLLVVNLSVYVYGADKNRRACWVKQIARTKVVNLSTENLTSPDCPNFQVQTQIILCGSWIPDQPFKFDFQRHFASPLAYGTLIDPENICLHE